MSNYKNISNSRFRNGPEQLPPLRSAYTRTSTLIPSVEIAKWDVEKSELHAARMSATAVVATPSFRRNETFVLPAAEHIPLQPAPKSRFISHETKPPAVAEPPRCKRSAEFNHLGERVDSSVDAADALDCPEPPYPVESDTTLQLVEQIMSKSLKNRENNHIKTSEEDEDKPVAMAKEQARPTSAASVASVRGGGRNSRKKKPKHIKRKLSPAARRSLHVARDDLESVPSSELDLAERTRPPKLLRSYQSVMTQSEIGVGFAQLQLQPRLCASTQTLETAASTDWAPFRPRFSQSQLKCCDLQQSPSVRDLFESSPKSGPDSSYSPATICLGTLLFAALFAWTYANAAAVLALMPQCMRLYVANRWQELFVPPPPPVPERTVYESVLSDVGEMLATSYRLVVCAVYTVFSI